MRIWWAYGFWATILATTLPIMLDHLARLFPVPTYGLAPIIPLVATFCLVAWRWDWKLRLPSELLSIGLLLVGAAFIASSLALDEPLLRPLACLFVYCSFLCCHRDRRHERTLIGLAWPLLAVAISLTSLGTGHIQHLVKQVTGVSARLLRFADIPYIQLNDTLAVAQGRFYVSEQIHSFLAWPSFLAYVLVYSALRRRSWGAVLLSSVASYFLCIVFHSGLIVANAISYGAGVDSWFSAPIVLNIASGLVVLVLFLSSDRFFEAILFPITDETESPIANPIVSFWNSMWGKPSAGIAKSKRSTKRDWGLAGFVVSLISLIAMATGGVVQAAALRNAFAEIHQSLDRGWSAAPKLFSNLDQQQLTVDHREISGMQNERWGTVADVWTITSTNEQTEFVVTQQPKGIRPIASIYERQGWYDQVSTNPSDLQRDGSDAINVIRLIDENEKRHALLLQSAISRAGAVRSIDEVQQAGGVDIWTVHSFTQFLREPSDVSIQILTSRFEMQLRELSRELGAAQGR